MERRRYDIKNTECAELINEKVMQDLRKEQNIVLTDNEYDVLLEVVAPMLNGNMSGWRFSEGEGGGEFSARVEDENFLSKVKAGEVPFLNGTSILASVRIVQRKNDRLITDRIVKVVYDTIIPSGKLLPS